MDALVSPLLGGMAGLDRTRIPTPTPRPAKNPLTVHNRAALCDPVFFSDLIKSYDYSLITID